jgi:hypothetical protein
MGTTVVFTIIAFIVIVAGEGFEPLSLAELKDHAHPAIGMVCIVATMIQPLMAALRPDPGTDHRWIFNIAHFINGHIAFAFGFAAIFLGMEYDDMNMPPGVKYALIGYAVVHFVKEMVLTFLKYNADKHPKQVNIFTSVTLRHAPPRSVTLRHALLRSATLRHAPPRSATLRHAPPRSATLRHAPPRSATLRHAPPRHCHWFA